MRVLDVLNSPWAIIPDKLIQLEEVYWRYLRAEPFTQEQIIEAIGERKELLNDLPKADKIAVIPIEGVISKRMNMFQNISGGTSTELLERDFKAALADPEVMGIILHVDSPGGSVNGISDFANLVFQSRGQKPVVAFTDGLMASAAYWIGSAADHVMISSDTTMVGSIGVVATHRDFSKAEDQAGIKTTQIKAGKFKQLTSEHGPLSDLAKETIQGQVDYLYSVFVGEVAQFRGVSVSTVLKDMADGKVFVGRQAIESGLVDDQGTFEQAVGFIVDNQGNQGREIDMSKPTTAPSSQQAASLDVIPTITVASLKENNPEVANALASEGYTDGFKNGRAEGETWGKASERKRIKGVEEQALVGHERLIQELKYDGVTEPEIAAVKVLTAEKAIQKDRNTQLHTEAPKPVVEIPSESDGSLDQKRIKLIAEVKAELDCDDKKATVEASRRNPELFKNR